MTAAQIVRAVGYALIVGALSFTSTTIIAGWGPGPFVAAVFFMGLVLVIQSWDRR